MSSAARPPSFTALVLAAGKGTRMRSARAKVLHEIGGWPLCAFPVAAALEAGARRVVVVVGHQSDAVEARLRALFGDRLTFVLQREQRGTGHAVRTARRALEAAGARSVMVLNGDLPLCTAATLRRLLQAGGQGPVALLTTRLSDPRGYGRVVRSGGRRGPVERIVEHQDATREERRIDEVNTGAYLFDRALLFEALGKARAGGKKKEIYLTDVIAFARRRGARIVAREVRDPAEVLGVNDRRELAAAGALLRARINDAHMRRGVTFEDPAATYVDVGVRLGRDVTLGAGVHLLGATTLAAGCTVEAGAVLHDATLEAGARVLPYSVIEGARLARGAQVGPFCRLRPGTVVGPGARLGNFVEAKKATIGRGAKAGHLTYLGDATVGPGANIGAGTITCNYDGAAKHPTAIGAGAFIGSNTALVAPVAVGDGAYVGAGSTITKEVPAGALGLSRARQRNLEGWAERSAPRKEAPAGTRRETKGRRRARRGRGAKGR